MFNYNKLRGRIKEKGFTQERLAEQINIDKSTLSLRLNNHSLFMQDEIFKIINILDIPLEDIKEYFFTYNV